MFTDVAALILAYAGTSFAERAPTKQFSFGENASASTIFHP